MTRPLAETEAELALHQKRRDLFDRFMKGGRTQAEQALDLEALRGVTVELMALEEKRKPPPRERVYPEAWQMTREQAAAKAAEIRSDPRYFKGPGYRHPDGVTPALSETEHELLVETVADLMDRATEVG